MTAISQTLADALAAQRSELNARFRVVQSLHQGLDSGQLFDFMRECVDPLILAVQREHSSDVQSVVRAAYDSALQLLLHRSLNSPQQRAWLKSMWRGVLSRVPALVASEPGRLIGALNNALLNIGGSGHTIAERWLIELERIAPRCARAEQLLACGQVLAWRAGLAHYRDGSLQLLQSFEPSLLSAVMDVDPTEASDVVGRIRRDRWFDPRHVSDGQPRVLARVGSFRGFGGQFVQPPVVAPHGDGWVVRSGAEQWFLTADAFGHSFHRASTTEWEQGSQQRGSRVASFNGARLRFAQRHFDFDDAGPITAVAEWGDAVACTTALSHHVIIVVPR